MLLETAVKKSVELIVGEVEHSQRTADLADKSKARRRQVLLLEPAERDYFTFSVCLSISR